MNSIHKKTLLILGFFMLLPACGWGGGGMTVNEQNNVELCNKAKNGVLDINAIDLNSPQQIAYLFNCAVSVRIGEADESRQKYLDTQKNKMHIASVLLVKGVDVSYVNDDGDTLLMTVVISFLPDEWKYKTSQSLISKGVDIKHKNLNGDTALDLAKFKKDKAIIKLLDNK
jgi:ankyrin repeat protein